MKPISPDDVAEIVAIPEFVIDVVNHLIRTHYDNGRAIVEQKEIVKEVREYMRVHEVFGQFKFTWLNFEELYRGVGWNVEYDKPGYNESYEANFKFTKKEK